MITANVIHRVFWIRCGSAMGTAFAIDVDGKQYLTTARHVVTSVPSPLSVEVFSNGAWASLPARLVGHGLADVDVSVLATDRRLTPSDLLLEASSDGMAYGQEVFFLGFPYGMTGRFLFGTDGCPLPLVKRATLSLFHGSVYLLDGHNNPGFSGGPVVFSPPGVPRYKVAGIISGFQANEEPIYSGGQPTPLVYKYNTGIIVSHPIERAVELIRSNPDGYDLTIGGTA